jgi:hypothetical protein
MGAPNITTLLSPNPASGNTTANGTEQTLASAASAAGIYQLDFDRTNMTDGDVTELRAYKKVNGGAAEHLIGFVSLGPAGTPTEAIVEFGPFATSNCIKFTMKQIAGTNRAYQWGVLNFTGA